VKALLTWKGHPIDPLPADVSLDNGRLVLILSNKKDVFYTVTPTKCSCPAATYHPGQPCKHIRTHFPGPQKSPEELEAEGDNILAAHNSGARRLARPPEESSIRPTCKWPGGFNGPVDKIPGEEKARASSSLSVIDCHDTSDKDAAYWSNQEDKTMWPAEA
jgi:hypothetical protein